MQATTTTTTTPAQALVTAMIAANLDEWHAPLPCGDHWISLTRDRPALIGDSTPYRWRSEAYVATIAHEGDDDAVVVTDERWDVRADDAATGEAIAHVREHLHEAIGYVAAWEAAYEAAHDACAEAGLSEDDINLGDLWTDATQFAEDCDRAPLRFLDVVRERIEARSDR
jgi:hypothetical protein